MKTKILSILMGLSVVLGGASVHAQGLIGQDYAAVEGSWLRLQNGESLNLYGGALSVNYAAYNDGANFGVDVGASIGNAVDDKKGITVQDTAIVGSVVPYVVLGDGFTLFGQGVVGWDRIRVSVDGEAQRESKFLWSVGGGIEYAIDQFSVAGIVSYSQLAGETRSGTWAFGGSTNYWINEAWGTGIAYNFLDYKSGTGHQVVGSVRYRF